ncbi:MAG: TIGR02302 family protein [Salaquimonas sp.]
MAKEGTQIQNTKAEKPAAAETRHFSAGKTVYLLSYLAEVWERLWPRLVPFFLTACVFVTLSWAGVWQQMPDFARWASLVLFVAIVVAALTKLHGFKLPSDNQIHRRIEKASGFAHRPVTAQLDTPTNNDDPFAAALWQEHKKRMAAELDNLAAGSAQPNGNLFDRFALRAILPLAAFIALGFSYSSNGGRIGDIFEPRIDTQLVISRLDMWVTPPSYTAKPPFYFAAPLQDSEPKQQTASVETLEGSELSINYVGAEPVTARIRSGEEIVNLEPRQDENLGVDDLTKNFTSTLENNSLVEIMLKDQVIASWQLDITRDAIPEIFLDEVPRAALSGALELNYSVRDDFGVISAKGLVERAEAGNENARPLVEAPQIDLPLPRARARTGSSKVNRDLSSHPWAGSDVILTLEVTDDPGQVGKSQPITIQLPGRRFIDPMAKALVEQRRLLALDANSAPYVANLLDAVTTHPEEFKIDPKAYLALQSAYRMIVPANDDDKLREAMDILWETALALELGDLSEVERKLREAQEKLAEALEDGASDEEIEKLMDELRQAMNDFLEQMAKEMARNPIENNPLSNRENTQTLTERDLDKMMQRIEDLAKSGSKDAARELLAEMQRMMDNMRAGQHQQQNQAEGNELNQALDKLSELMQQQQQLMDETFSMQRRQPQQKGEGQQDQQQGEQQQGQQGEQNPDGSQNGDENGPMTPEEFAEALEQLRQQQEALQKQLSELGQELEDLGLDPSEGFGEAGEEMAQAGKNLGEGQAGDAAGNQGQALEALRQGAQSMMQQMAGDRGGGGQQQGQAGQDGQQRRGNDPLGRENGGDRQFGSEDTKIPGEIDAQRAREIMDAIRKRLSDPLRPLIERDYLERLLQSR